MEKSKGDFEKEGVKVVLYDEIQKLAIELRTTLSANDRYINNSWTSEEKQRLKNYSLSFYNGLAHEAQSNKLDFITRKALGVAAERAVKALNLTDTNDPTSINQVTLLAATAPFMWAQLHQGSYKSMLRK